MKLINSGRWFAVWAVLITAIVLTLSACEGFFDILETDIDAAGTESTDTEEGISYGTIAGEWVTVGPAVSTAAANPDTPRLSSSSLLIHDGTIHIAGPSSVWRYDEDAMSLLSDVDPALFLFSMPTDGSEWDGEETPILTLDISDGEGFGNVKLERIPSFSESLTISFSQFSDNSINEIKSVFADGSPASEQTIQDLGLERVDYFDSWTDSNYRFLAVSGGDDVSLLRTMNGGGGTFTEADIAGPTDFINSVTGVGRHSFGMRRGWDLAPGGSNYILIGGREGENNLRVWRQGVTSDSWSLRSISFNYDTEGFGLAPRPYNVRAVPNSGNTGVYAAVIYYDTYNSQMRHKSGMVFEITGSTVNDIEPLGTRFFGPSGYMSNPAVGDLLDIYVTSQGNPVVVWNSGVIYAAEYSNGAWNYFGGTSSSGITAGQQTPMSTAYDHATDTLYVLVAEQLYRFERD
ncbi:hypothetical protein [Spirochaeta dissipatitropha]